MAAERKRPNGRPRDNEIDERAMATTLELLATVGFEGTTVQAVAANSGLHASALYRRWSSRIELIEDAIAPVFAKTEIPLSGDFRRDLRRFVRAYAATFAPPAARAAMPGLLAHYQTSGSRRPEEWLPISARPQFLEIIQSAPPGTIDPAIELEDVFDVLLGAILARLLVPTVADRQRPLERVVELTLKMLETPTTMSAAGTGAFRTPRRSRLSS